MLHTMSLAVTLKGNDKQFCCYKPRMKSMDMFCLDLMDFRPDTLLVFFENNRLKAVTLAFFQVHPLN